MFTRSILLGLVAAVDLATAHVLIAYPAWRGNNLITNYSSPNLLPTDDPSAQAVTYSSNGTVAYPFGMQFSYPCGGLPVTTNRTDWPIGGGAVSFGPGYGFGFKTSYIYINIGKTEYLTEAPANYSHSLTPPLALTGKNESDWPGQICVPQTAMPAGLGLTVGDNATIQVVQVAATGEAVYSCADVTLRDNTDSRIANINAQNCYNSTDINIQQIFTTISLTSGAERSLATSPLSMFALAAASAAYVLL